MWKFCSTKDGEIYSKGTVLKIRLTKFELTIFRNNLDQILFCLVVLFIVYACMYSVLQKLTTIIKLHKNDTTTPRM